MTQVEAAKRNITTDLVKRVAKQEHVKADFIRNGLKRGTIVIPCNRSHRLSRPCAIGKGLPTKINANIGSSPYHSTVSEELKKLELCIRFKADTVMDLSTGNNLVSVRKAILKRSTLPVGTVPLYEVAARAKLNKVAFEKISGDDIFEVVQRQAEEGVDFFTIHAGVTEKVLSTLKKAGRIAGIVSRGGALIGHWMKKNRRENPFYENFDRLLAIVKEHDVTLSLGDGLRPGSICDATDRPQIEELKILASLARKATENGVQTMIEGPGHVPINQIQANVEMQKRLCKDAPFYVLGPLVTDISSGYDHISSSIGAALAATYGADFLCYVTPSEHLGIPTLADVKDGLIAYRIAAHSADIAKGIKGAIEWDRTVSRFRRGRNWNKHIRSSLDPKRAKALHNRYNRASSDVCTMCADYCPLKIYEQM